MLIHSVGLYYRILEFRGVFAPQFTVNGNNWCYFYVGRTPVELSSLSDAQAYIVQSI